MQSLIFEQAASKAIISLHPIIQNSFIAEISFTCCALNHEKNGSKNEKKRQQTIILCHVNSSHMQIITSTFIRYIKRDYLCDCIDLLNHNVHS